MLPAAGEQVALGQLDRPFAVTSAIQLRRNVAKDVAKFAGRNFAELLTPLIKLLVDLDYRLLHTTMSFLAAAGQDKVLAAGQPFVPIGCVQCDTKQASLGRIRAVVRAHGIKCRSFRWRSLVRREEPMAYQLAVYNLTGVYIIFGESFPAEFLLPLHSYPWFYP